MALLGIVAMYGEIGSNVPSFTTVIESDSHDPDWLSVAVVFGVPLAFGLVAALGSLPQRSTED